jgi:hypothetical protein
MFLEQKNWKKKKKITIYMDLWKYGQIFIHSKISNY